MIECGKVIKIKRNNAVVSFDRKSACDQCHMCAVSKSGKTVEITIPNVLDAEIGDTVEVTMGSRYVLTAAVIVYVIPLILVAAAVFIGEIWSDTVAIILTFVALAVGFAIAILLDKYVIRKKKGFVPEMTKLVLKAGDEEKLIEIEKKYAEKQEEEAPEEVSDADTDSAEK